MSQASSSKKRAFPWDENPPQHETKKSKVASPSIDVTAYPVASGPSSPSKKRATKKAPVEKRGARVRSQCPKNILERVDRVMSQRFVRCSFKLID